MFVINRPDAILLQKYTLKTVRDKINMHNVQQQFKKNYTIWDNNDKEIVEQFFICNPFFSKFYQNKKLLQIARICLYRKLQSGQQLSFENNNRAQAIILLNGDCIVKKKQRKIKIKKKAKTFSEDVEQKSQKIKNKQRYQQSPSNYQEQFEYNYLTHLKQFNQTLTLNSQSIVQIPSNHFAQILFVPCGLYNKLQQQIQQERVEKIKNVLEKFFFKLKKKQLHELSQANCYFREFKMNNYIYRACSKPEDVFLLLEGMVKLEKPGFSQQTLKENILVNPGMIFGEKDIKLQERTRNAVSCTSHVEVLTIPKIPFLKYVTKAFPDIIFEEQKSSPTKLPKLDQNLRLSHSLKVSPTKNSLLPFIRRRSHFHESSVHIQSKKTQSEQKREYDLIRNSHILLDINSKKERKFQLRKFSPKSKQEMQQLLNNQKTKLKQLKLQSRFSLNNSLLNL